MPAAQFDKFFLLVFLLLSFFSTSVYSQQTEESSEPDKSYFKLSAAYLSNAVYHGRRDSLTIPYLSPSLSYHNKSGLYFEASLSYLASKGASQIDETSLTAGYEYESKNEKLSGDAYVSKYFYNSASYSVNSEVKYSVANYLSYNAGPVTINSVTELLFSGKTDINQSLGLSHSFSFDEDEKWSVAPAILANAGTQNFYDNYFTNRKYSVKRRRRAVAPVTTVKILNNKFSVLDYEVSSPIYYDNKRWGLFVTPTFAIPVNPLKFSINNGVTYTTEKLSNSFYLEAGIYIKL